MFQLDIDYPNGLSYEPISYSGQPETHLDIQCLIEEEQAKREKANFFVCCICAMIVKDPLECDSCQSLFCSQCLAPWRASNRSCPKKCQGSNDVEFKNLHRYVKGELMLLRFKCGLGDCDFEGTYEEAMAHKFTCKNQFQQCVQGCGLGIMGKDMEYHCLKQCKLFKIECEICEEASYPNDPERGGLGIDGHDCVQVLKRKLKEAREEIAMLKAGGAGYGALSGNGRNVVIRCNQGCCMQKKSGYVESYEGGILCDVCGIRDMH